MVLREKPMMLNGYMLVERIKKEKESTLEVIDKDEERIGIIRYMDEPNVDYLDKWEYDDDIVNVGNKVILSYTHYKRLEDPLHRIFDKNKEYLVVQRKQIAAVLKKKYRFSMVVEK